MAKKRKTEDIYYPVPQQLNLTSVGKVETNPDVVKRIIQGTVRLAFSLKPPSRFSYDGETTRAKAVATNEQMETVIHLIESLHPQDAIEAALASQFAISYLRAMETGTTSFSFPLNLFEFGHKVLEALQKYRSKGAQQISVQYNVNQGQVVNIKPGSKAEPEPTTIDGEAYEA